MVIPAPSNGILSPMYCQLDFPHFTIGWLADLAPHHRPPAEAGRRAAGSGVRVRCKAPMCRTISTHARRDDPVCAAW